MFVGKRLPAPRLRRGIPPAAATPLDRAGEGKKGWIPTGSSRCGSVETCRKAARAQPGRETARAEAGPPEQLTWQQYP